MPQTIVGLYKSGKTCTKRDTFIATAAAADRFDHIQSLVAAK